MEQESLAEALRVLRARRGLTVREASESIGVQWHTLRDLETGKRKASYPTLGKIAKGYDVPVEDLLALAEEPAPKATAPSSPAEVSPEEQREEDYIDKLLSAWSGFLWDTVHRWETAGYELQFAEISSILSTLEGLVATGLFHRSEAADPTDVYEAKRDFELEMTHKAVQRLREAAEPVLEARAKDRKDREAQRVRRGFEVVEGSMRRAS